MVSTAIPEEAIDASHAPLRAPLANTDQNPATSASEARWFGTATILKEHLRYCKNRQLLLEQELRGYQTMIFAGRSVSHQAKSVWFINSVKVN